MLARMHVTDVRAGYEVWHPNREKASSKTMKAIVAFVLLVSAALVIIITIGGWERLLGANHSGAPRTASIRPRFRRTCSGC